jgi:hypothetical protein
MSEMYKGVSPVPVKEIMNLVRLYISRRAWIKIFPKGIRTGSPSSLDSVKIIEPKAVKIDVDPDYILIEKRRSFDENYPEIYSVRLGYPAYEIIITIASKNETEAFEIIDVDVENR